MTNKPTERWKAEVYLDLYERRNPGTDEFAKGFNGGIIEARNLIYAKLPALISAILASAPQEPDDALAEAETYRQMHATARELGYPSILEALEALSRLKAQEPVADDDAEWLRKFAAQRLLDGCRDRLERIATHLQAKAPETGEE